MVSYRGRRRGLVELVLNGGMEYCMNARVLLHLCDEQAIAPGTAAFHLCGWTRYLPAHPGLPESLNYVKL